MDISKIVTLTSFNYYEWKSKIEILLRNKGLYRATMALEIEPNAVVEKARWHNRKDEAYGFLCLSLYLELIFHLHGLKFPNEVCIKLESLFGKQDDLRGHQLENELISLRQIEFETIEESITKFNSLVIFLK